MNSDRSSGHGIGKSITLHLAPGVLTTAAFILIAPIFMKHGLPPLLAFHACLLFVTLPFQLICLLLQGKRPDGSVPPGGIVRFRERIPPWQYAVFIPCLFAWAVFVFTVVDPLYHDALMGRVFFFIPSWFDPSVYMEDLWKYARPVRIATWYSGLLLVAFLGPFTEEPYFRGFLLPRLLTHGNRAPSTAGITAVLLHTALFTLYHFWSPWLFFTRFLAVLPMTYVVYRKKNIYIAIATHCALNLTGDSLLTIPLFFG